MFASDLGCTKTDMSLSGPNVLSHGGNVDSKATTKRTLVYIQISLYYRLFSRNLASHDLSCSGAPLCSPALQQQIQWARVCAVGRPRITVHSPRGADGKCRIPGLVFLCLQGKVATTSGFYEIRIRLSGGERPRQV